MRNMKMYNLYEEKCFQVNRPQWKKVTADIYFYYEINLAFHKAKKNASALCEERRISCKNINISEGLQKKYE